MSVRRTFHEEEYLLTIDITADSFGVDAERQEDGIARPGSASDGFDVMSPAEAAAIILNGYQKGKPMITVGRVARLSYWLNRLSPRLYERIMAKKVGAGH